MGVLVGITKAIHSPPLYFSPVEGGEIEGNSESGRLPRIDLTTRVVQSHGRLAQLQAGDPAPEFSFPCHCLDMAVPF